MTVNIDKFLTPSEHAAEDHAGLDGVGNLNNGAGPAGTTNHATLSHSGVSGVGNLNNGAGPAGTTNHATLSHAGIPGVGDPLPAATYGQQAAGWVVGTDGVVSLNLTSQSGSWRFVQLSISRQNADGSGTRVGWRTDNFMGHNTGSLQLNATEAKGGFTNQFLILFVSTLSPAQT